MHACIPHAQVRTEDGKFFDCVVEGEHIRDEWIAALPDPPAHTMQGWVYERHSSALGLSKENTRVRYAIFDILTAHFAIYLTEESALLDDTEPQFACAVKYAPPPPPPLQSPAFACPCVSRS